MATKPGMYSAMAAWCDCTKPWPAQPKISLDEIQREFDKLLTIKTFRQYWNEGVAWLRAERVRGVQQTLPVDLPWTDPRELKKPKTLKSVVVDLRPKKRKRRKQLDLLGVGPALGAKR